MWPAARVSGLVLRASRSHVLRRRQDRARPGRGLCASARAGPWLRPSAGCRRCSTISRRAGAAGRGDRRG
ncbi:MAG: hypothetical protein MZV49_09770 [Rhodopseudomonas palustris]|nr:hypothetical protein [Rhodopseudomonas palustris]